MGILRCRVSLRLAIRTRLIRRLEDGAWVMVVGVMVMRRLEDGAWVRSSSAG